MMVNRNAGAVPDITWAYWSLVMDTMQQFPGMYGLNALVVEDETRPDCMNCQYPVEYTEPETDEEISLRMWEEYESTLVESESYVNQSAFPDWLKEQTK